MRTWDLEIYDNNSIPTAPTETPFAQNRLAISQGGKKKGAKGGAFGL